MNFFVRMERYLKILLVLALCFGMTPALSAQEQLTPEEKEKKFYEFIEKEVERYESTLKLESWQVFYVDSILTHDYRAMQEEYLKSGAGREQKARERRAAKHAAAK